MAKELLGKFLVRKTSGKEVAAMITETEAYDGPHDLASHASKGKTERTAIMFGKPGNFYVYLIYGMYHMLNVVTREEGYPAAVLIRGVSLGNERYDGPGKVTRYLAITGTFNKQPASTSSNLWFEDRRVKVAMVKKLPRVGVHYAGPVFAAKKLRFLFYPQGR